MRRVTGQAYNDRRLRGPRQLCNKTILFHPKMDYK
jgi:hypothetical protein